MRNATMLGACTALLMFPMQRVLSQTPDSITSARAEDVMARVRRLTTNDVASARQLADSLVRVLPSTAAVMPAALFAKASIAPSAADAERGYERIVNDYRFAPQVPDALMRLAQLGTFPPFVIASRAMIELIGDIELARNSRASLEAVCKVRVKC